MRIILNWYVYKKRVANIQRTRLAHELNQTENIHKLNTDEKQASKKTHSNWLRTRDRAQQSRAERTAILNFLTFSKHHNNNKMRWNTRLQQFSSCIVVRSLVVGVAFNGCANYWYWLNIGSVCDRLLLSIHKLSTSFKTKTKPRHETKISRHYVCSTHLHVNKKKRNVRICLMDKITS